MMECNTAPILRIFTCAFHYCLLDNIFGTFPSTLPPNPKEDTTCVQQSSIPKTTGTEINQVMSTLHSRSKGKVRTVEKGSSGGERAASASDTLMVDKVSLYSGEAAEKATLAWSLSSTDSSFPTLMEDYVNVPMSSPHDEV